jgi:hypothetical protein
MNLLQISTLKDDIIKLSRNAGYTVTRGNTQERRQVHRCEKLKTQNKILVKTYCIHNVIKTRYLNCNRVNGQSTKSNLYFYSFTLVINLFLLVQLIRHSSEVFININSVLYLIHILPLCFKFPHVLSRHFVDSMASFRLHNLMLQLRSDMLFQALRVPLRILIDFF